MENATTQTRATTANNRKDIHQHVTDTIIKQLEAGTVPWQKPWKGGTSPFPSLPVNYRTGNRYKGVNILLLWSSAIGNNFSTDEWATFKQWSEAKEMIRKGEKGSLVVYYDTMEKEVDGEIKEIPFLKSSYVFNRCQLTSYQPPETEAESQPEDDKTFDRIMWADDFIEATGAVIEHSGESAHYNRVTDKIHMPYEKSFFSTETCLASEHYYQTLFHELTHWTGSPARLQRNKGKKFGDKYYANEELVAELGAAFLCADLEITATPKKDHANYIAGWLKALKDNKHCIFTAASEASKAIDYLHTLHRTIQVLSS